MAKHVQPGANLNGYAALRIVDANFNRASEGLRVIEEFFRFAASDAYLARRCKELRHELTEVLAVISSEDLARARQTERDVGTGISIPTEHHRQSLEQVVAASCKRVEQALRAMEEYGKLLPPLDAGRLEQLRYQAYTLGKAILTQQAAAQNLAAARLYVLIDGGPNQGFSEDLYRCRVAELVSAGVSFLQLRDKSLDDRMLLARGLIIRDLTRGTATRFIMNDRADLAILCQADGVHLGQEDLPVFEVRQLVGAKMLIGVSTHTIEQARQAVLDGADYLGCGPTFLSSTKHFEAFPGLPFLRQVSREITLPSFAIGGITPENLSQVLETGIERVAVGAAVWNAAVPQSRAAALLRQLDFEQDAATDAVDVNQRRSELTGESRSHLGP